MAHLGNRSRRIPEMRLVSHRLDHPLVPRHLEESVAAERQREWAHSEPLPVQNPHLHLAPRRHLALLDHPHLVKSQELEQPPVLLAPHQVGHLHSGLLRTLNQLLEQSRPLNQHLERH